VTDKIEVSEDPEEETEREAQERVAHQLKNGTQSPSLVD